METKTFNVALEMLMLVLIMTVAPETAPLSLLSTPAPPPPLPQPPLTPPSSPRSVSPVKIASLGPTPLSELPLLPPVTSSTLASSTTTPATTNLSFKTIFVSLDGNDTMNCGSKTLPCYSLECSITNFVKDNNIQILVVGGNSTHTYIYNVTTQIIVDYDLNITGVIRYGKRPMIFVEIEMDYAFCLKGSNLIISSIDFQQSDKALYSLFVMEYFKGHVVIENSKFHDLEYCLHWSSDRLDKYNVTIIGVEFQNIRTQVLHLSYPGRQTTISFESCIFSRSNVDVTDLTVSFRDTVFRNTQDALWFNGDGLSTHIHGENVTFISSDFTIDNKNSENFSNILFSNSRFINSIISIKGIYKVELENTNFNNCSCTFQKSAIVKITSNCSLRITTLVIGESSSTTKNSSVFLTGITVIMSKIEIHNVTLLSLDFCSFVKSVLEIDYKDTEDESETSLLTYNIAILHSKFIESTLASQNNGYVSITNVTFDNLCSSSVQEEKRFLLTLVNIADVEVTDSLFNNSATGGVFVTNCSSVRFIRCNITNNVYTYPSEGGGGGLRSVDSKVTLSHCFFKNNTAVYYNYAGTIYHTKKHLYVRNTYLIGPHVLAFVPIAVMLYFKVSKNVDFYNGTRIRCSRSSTISINNLTSGEDILTQYSCAPCEKGTYKLSGSELIVLNSKFKKLNANCVTCPYGGVCEYGIRSKGNFWGFIEQDHQSKTSKTYKMVFKKCPQRYCCRNPVDCISYDTCAANRKGILCGSCKSNHSVSLTGNFECIPNTTCRTSYFPFYFVGIFLFLILLLYIKEILVHIKFWLKPYKEERKDGRGDSIVSTIDDTDVAQQLLASTESNISSRSRSPYHVVYGEADVASQNYVQQRQHVSGLLKIVVFFYQAASIIRVSSEAKQSINLTLVIDFLTTVFDIRLSIKSNSIISVCLFPNQDVVSSEITKVMFIVLLFCIILLLIGIQTGWEMTSRKMTATTTSGMENRNIGIFHCIDDTVPMYSRVPWKVRLVCGYLSLYLFSYSTVTSIVFSMVNCVKINGELRLFMQGDVKCFSNLQIACFVFIVLVNAPFCVSLYAGCKWLQACKITPLKFLLMITFPPISLFYGVQIIMSRESLLLGRDDGMLAKHLLLVVNEPFRNHKDGRRENLEWEWILIGRRLLLIILATFIPSDVAKMAPITVMILVFLFHHTNKQPYDAPYLNILETVSLMILVFLSMINMFWAFSNEFLVSKSTSLYYLGVVFISFEFAVMILPIVSIVLIILAIVGKQLFYCYKRFLRKQD